LPFQGANGGMEFHLLLNYNRVDTRDTCDPWSLNKPYTYNI
jgi:hypothetical protein